MATSTSGLVQIDSKTIIDANPFGLYICQLNASDVTFQRSVLLKEQGITINDIKNIRLREFSLIAANLRMTIDARNPNICSGPVVSSVTLFIIASVTTCNDRDL